MTAFIFSILIFLACFFVGYTIFPNRDFFQDKLLGIFLSPVLGLGLIIVIINFANRSGIPVKYLAWPILALVLISGFLTFRRLGMEKILLRTVTFLIGLPLLITTTTWPMLKYGFHWYSYVNDDMNNYVLGAMRFYQTGFYTKPDFRLLAGMDYSQLYYYFEPKQGIRPGSELFLALVSSFHHGNSLQVFMPTIVALQMVFIAVTVALIRVSIGVKRWQTLTALCLLVALPLVNLGFLYQLIGQVGGTAFAVGIIVLVTLLFKSEGATKEIRLYLLLALLLSGLLIWYPEILPFIGIAIIISFVVSQKFRERRLWIGMAGVTLFSLLILNKYFFQALHYSASQLSSTTSIGKVNKLQLFPYFLRPHGVAAIFGLSPLNKSYGALWEATSICFGLLLFAILAITPFLQPLIFRTADAVTLVMIAGIIFLVRSLNGFGSYKLAMFMQPFLVCTLIALMGKIFSRFEFKWSSSYKTLPWFVMGAVCLYTLVATTQFYVLASTGTKNNGFSEVPEVSSANVVGQIYRAEKTYESSMGPILSVSNTVSQTKLEAIASQGKPILFLSRDPFKSLPNSLVDANSFRQRNEVSFPDGQTSNQFEQFSHLLYDSKENWYLLPYDTFSSFNKSTYSTPGKFWDYHLIKNPVDYLVFVNSSLYPIFDGADTQSSAVLFSSEPNPMIPKTFTQSVGDTLLVQVVDFQPNSKLVLNLSSTVLSQYFRRIPNVTVVGANVVTVHPEGTGSARLVVPNILPLSIGGQDYLEIKFDQELKPFPDSASALSNIYGSQVVLDSRMISTFLSDISLRAPNSNLNLTVPSYVSSFPKDLVNSGLSYSGAYEDGWMSQSFHFNLAATGSRIINFSGYVPEVTKHDTFKTSVVAYIDGILTKTFILNTGNFSIDIQPKISLVAGTIHKIEFRFMNSQILPIPDGRPATVFLGYLGFKGGN